MKTQHKTLRGKKTVTASKSEGVIKDSISDGVLRKEDVFSCDGDVVCDAVIELSKLRVVFWSLQNKKEVARAGDMAVVVIRAEHLEIALGEVME